MSLATSTARGTSPALREHADRAPAAPSAAKLVAFVTALNTACVLEAAVGVAWQAAFARALGVSLRWHHTALLLGCLWLVYAADRWLDARGLDLTQACTQRHRVFARYPKPIAGLWMLVLASCLGVALLTLTFDEWCLGGLFLSATAGYFVLVHQRKPPGWVKESAASVLYAAGTLLFVWPEARFSLSLIAAELAFTGLVLLNLTTIAGYERHFDQHQGFESSATHGRVARPPVARLGTAVALLALLGLALERSAFADLFWALFLATLGTLLLQRIARRLGPELAHSTADLVLLVPLFFL